MQRLPHVKKPLRFNYYTPSGNRPIAIMRYREWLEIFPDEVIYAHESHEKVLFSYGFKRCKGVTVYRTQKQALKPRRKNIRGVITE